MGESLLASDNDLQSPSCRFSCFNAQVHRHKPKKSFEGFSEGLIRENGSKSKRLSSIILGRNIASVSGNSKPSTSTAIERVWKSEEIKPTGILDHDIAAHQVRHLKESQSHGDELYLNGSNTKGNGIADRTEQITSPNSHEEISTFEVGSRKHIEERPNLYQKAPRASVSAYQDSDQALNGSISSVGDLHHTDKDSQHPDE